MALEDVNAWSVTAAANSNADAGINWSEGQTPGTVNDSARAMMAAIAKKNADENGSLVTGGTGAAYTLTPNAVPAALASGLRYTFKASADAVAGATLNVASLGAKSLRKFGASGEVAVAAADMKSGGRYTAIFDATANAGAGAWLLLNPSNVAGSFSTVTTTAKVSMLGATVYGDSSLLQSGFGLNTGLALVKPDGSQGFALHYGSDDHLYITRNGASLLGYFSYITGAYAAVSDAERKDRIADLPSQWNALKALAPKSYHMVGQGQGERRNLGFLYQDIKQIYPEAASEGDFKGLELTALLAPVVKVIQELQARVEALEAA